MSLRTRTAVVGAASAALMVVGTVASPAMAAAQTVSFGCSPLPLTIPITFDAGTLPAKLVAGQKMKQKLASVVVHLDGTTVGAAQAQGWTSVSGTVTSKGTDGTTPFKVTIPETALPTTPAQPLDINGSGSLTLMADKAGTYSVDAGKNSAFIQGYTNGTEANSATLDCSPAKGSPSLGSVKVSKDTTKSKVKATYSSAKQQVKGAVTVKSHYGLKPTGKVKVMVMKGSKKVATIKAKLNKKGMASFTAKKLGAGSYKVKASYGGDSALKGSSAKANVKK